jgi:rhodanese-related sulfurtransferase
MIANAQLPTGLEAFLLEHPHRPGLLLAGGCLALAFLIFAFRLASRIRERGRPTLSPLQAEELLLGPGALVVDLRDPDEFRAGHIRGCLHVPLAELPTRLPAPDPRAHRAMILVDETDRLSRRAFEVLTARGFQWVYVLRGGMRAWRRAHRPLVK